jgi:hypothetical protein
MSSLAPTLQEVRQRIARAAKKSLNEQNTKATLIEPVLRGPWLDSGVVVRVARREAPKPRGKARAGKDNLWAFLTLRQGSRHQEPLL